MADDIVASIIFRAVDLASEDIRRVGAEVGAAGEMARGSEPKWLAAGAAVAKYSMAVGAAGLVVAGAAVKMAADFQSGMEMVRTQAGASQVEVDKMSRAVLRMASDVGASPEALSAGLFHIESAGLRGAKALETLRAAAEGAKVGHADLESVTNALIAVTMSHIAGVHGEIDAMAQLNAIVGSGNMHMQDLTAAMSTGILPAARSAGLSLRDVGAALAVMTDNGVPAQDAATRLRMTFSLMEAPTSKASKALAEIGMNSKQMANDMRGPGGLLAALEDLKKHLEEGGRSAVDQAQIISAAFGGGRTSSAILTLIGNLDQLKGKYADQATAAKQFGADWQATERTVSAQFEKMKANAEVAGIEIGSALLPVVSNLLSVVVPLSVSIADWAAQNQQLVTTVLALAGAIGVLGVGIEVVTTGWGILMTVVGAGTAVLAGVQVATQALRLAMIDLGVAEGIVLAPFALIIGGIAAIAIGFVLAYEKIKPFHDAVNQLASAIGQKLLGTLGLAEQFLSAVGARLDQLTKKVGMTKGDLLALIPVIGPIIILFDHWSTIIHATGLMLDWFVTQNKQMITSLRNLISDIPVLGGLFDGLTHIVRDVGDMIGRLTGVVGNFLGMIGHKVDETAKSMQHYNAVNIEAMQIVSEMAVTHHKAHASIQNDILGTIKRMLGLGAVSGQTADGMVNDANRIANAWKSVPNGGNPYPMNAPGGYGSTTTHHHTHHTHHTAPTYTNAGPGNPYPMVAPGGYGSNSPPPPSYIVAGPGNPYPMVPFGPGYGPGPPTVAGPGNPYPMQPGGSGYGPTDPAGVAKLLQSLNGIYDQHKQAVQGSTAAVVNNSQTQSSILVQLQTSAGDFSGAVQTIASRLSGDLGNALSKVTLDLMNHSGSLQSDIATAQKARQAQEQFTQNQWDATFAAASVTEKHNMLAQAASGVISRFNSIQGAESAVDNANLAVLAAQSAVQVGLLQDLVTDTQDQTAVIQASAGVAKAVGDIALVGIKDQAGIITAQGAITQAKDTAALAVAQDQLRIAIDTRAADIAAAQWAAVVARDNLTIARDKSAADRANEAAQHVVEMDKLKVAIDQVQLTKDQMVLQMDTLQGVDIIASAFADVTDYEAKIQSDLSAIGADQGQIGSDQLQLGKDTATAAQIAAQGALTVAQDQQRLAMDQAAGDASSQAGQMRIALDQNQLARDQVAAQNKTNSLLSQNNSFLQSQMGAMLEALKNFRSGVTYHWIGSGPDPFESWLNGAQAQFAGNPSL